MDPFTAVACIVFAVALTGGVLAIGWVLYRAALDNRRIEAKEAELRRMRYDLWFELSRRH